MAIIIIGDIMFYNYKILDSNNEEILYLYVSSYFEFSKELDKRNKNESLTKKIREYLNDLNINFNGNKVMLIVDGLIIGSITNFNKFDSYIESKYRQFVDVDKCDNIDIIDIQDKNEIYQEKNVQNDYIIDSFVKMKSDDFRTTYVNINDYITHTVANLIPPTYEEEAIKSIAIIVRTEVLKELYENSYLKEKHYLNNSVLKGMWKDNYNKYLDKINKSVMSTDNQYLTNNHYYFNFENRKYQRPYSPYIANNLAKKGFNYVDILGQFYPDAFINVA